MSSKRKADVSFAQATKKTRANSRKPTVLQRKYNLPKLDLAKPGDTTIRITRLMRQTINALNPSTVVTDNGGFQSTAYIPFQLDQIPGYATLAAAFAEYRIERCTCIFMPKLNADAPSSAAGNLAWDTARLGWFQDDSGVALAAPFLATENAWLQREGYRQRAFDREIRVVCSPSPLSAMTTAAGAIETAIGSPSQWISTVNADLPHYGLKYRTYSQVAPATALGTLYVEYKVSFRQPQ